MIRIYLLYLCPGEDLCIERVCASHSVMFNSLTPWTIASFLCPWNSPDKNTRAGCHALLQGNLPDPGIKPVSVTSPALAGVFFTTSATWEAHLGHTENKNQWGTRQKLNIKMYKKCEWVLHKREYPNS